MLSLTVLDLKVFCFMSVLLLHLLFFLSRLLCLATALSNLRNLQSVDSNPIKEVLLCLSRVSLFNKTCQLLSCYVIMTGNLTEIEKSI